MELSAIKAALPAFLEPQLAEYYGAETADRILTGLGSTRPTTLRSNTLRSSAADVAESLAAAGFPTTQVPWYADAFVLGENTQGVSLWDTPLIKEGRVYVQSLSSMLPPLFMDLKPGMDVLDMCAAPGGKTTQIALSLGEEGRVTALDIHKHKVDLIAKNAARLGLKDKVEPVQLDARKAPQHFARESFSKILVDAPCSGLGLIRRKPEIRYDKKLDDSKRLHNIQLSILEAAAPVLKRGGQLTYSTCTILKQENQAVIDEFLKRNPDFKQVRTITKNKIKDDRKELALTIYPDDFLSDGFFIASLIKTGGE